MARKVTAEVRAKIGQFEGLRLSAYQDSVGVWTIGYGHTKGVKAGQKITKAQANAFLTADLAEAERAVDSLVKVELTDNQFGALVSFVFNVGTGAFRSSTLLKKLNASEYEAVPLQLARWNKGTVGGKKVVIPGLSNRRAAEAGLWATGEHVSSQDVPAAAAATPAKSKTIIGSSVAGAGAIGSALTDAASQTSVMVDYGDSFRWIFILLTIGGIGFAIYSRLKLRTEEGV